MNLHARVRQSLSEALARAALAGELGEAAKEESERAGWPTLSLERPKRVEHGDLATNAAMVLTKRVGKPPRVIADALVRALAGDSVIKSAEVAGPGFVNLRLEPSAFHDELSEILLVGAAYGRPPAATGERIDIEFVSANPTGPMHVGHARGAIFGDSVARLLEATGNRVVREYYINDFGNQTRLYADSVRAAAEGRPTPEGGYGGEYVAELARWLAKVDPAALQADQDTLARTSVTWTLRGIPGSTALRGIKQTLADLGVHFDVWFSEESLHRWGFVAVALRQLEDSGHLVRKDGALFFVATDEGADDKDRVVQKSDGAYTYFASDIAYHADKVARGYDRLLTFLGADHHGYVARVRNALEALGLPAARFEALLYQLVFIYRDGAPVKFSKRAGNIITAEEVILEIDEAAGRAGAGRDALRFFFLSRSANTNVEFDMDLAKKKTLDNPVFYVQYGHARLCSILRKADSLGFKPATRPLSPGEWSKLAHPDELALSLRLAEFPQVLRDAAEGREPHRVVFYVQELAREFQSYFTRLKDDPILPQESQRLVAGWEASWDHGKTAARLGWIEAIRLVYGAALDVLGVSAPTRMDRPKTRRTRTAQTKTRPPEAREFGMMDHGSVRNLEQIQEDDGTKVPRAASLAIVALGGACIVFATLALGGRKPAAATTPADPLGDLVAQKARQANSASPGASAVPAMKATDLSTGDVTFPSMLSDDKTQTTALAAVRGGGSAPVATSPTHISTLLAPPPPSDRLSVVAVPPLPAQSVLEATSVVTRPRDAMTKAASESAQLQVAAPPAASAGHDGGYQLQVSSFRTQAEANQFSDQLRARGHKSYVVEAHVAGRGTWYRVRIGPFTTQHAAMTYRSTFESKEHVVPFVVLPTAK